eukprot:3876830-Amphidinium_carterae.1
MLGLGALMVAPVDAVISVSDASMAAGAVCKSAALVRLVLLSVADEIGAAQRAFELLAGHNKNRITPGLHIHYECSATGARVLQHSFPTVLSCRGLPLHSLPQMFAVGRCSSRKPLAFWWLLLLRTLM